MLPSDPGDFGDLGEAGGEDMARVQGGCRAPRYLLLGTLPNALVKVRA